MIVPSAVATFIIGNSSKGILSKPAIVSLAYPDFSMPYNVIAITSTLIAFWFGSMFSILTRHPTDNSSNRLVQIYSKLVLMFSWRNNDKNVLTIKKLDKSLSDMYKDLLTISNKFVFSKAAAIRSLSSSCLLIAVSEKCVPGVIDTLTLNLDGKERSNFTLNDNPYYQNTTSNVDLHPPFCIVHLLKIQSYNIQLFSCQ